MSKKRDTWTAARYEAVRDAAARNSRKVIPDNGPSGPHDPPKPQPTASAPDHSASVAAHTAAAHAEAVATVAAVDPVARRANAPGPVDPLVAYAAARAPDAIGSLEAWTHEHVRQQQQIVQHANFDITRVTPGV